MKKINISLLALMVALSACNQQPKQRETAKADAPAMTAGDMQMANNENTDQVFKAYISLKDEFLKSDVAGIKSAATTLETKLAAIKGCTATATFARQIATATDVKEQRQSFLVLSQDIITLVKGAKLKTPPIFVDYCPMADSGKGGYWLSLNKTIENPYFPEQMKDCGQVKEQIN